MPPDWWRQAYTRGAHKPAIGKFDTIMRPATTDEVWRRLRGCNSDTSPGHDEVTTNMLKLCCDFRVLKGSLDNALPVPMRAPTTPVLEAVTALVNMSFRLAHVGDFLKHGLITMVPKTDKQDLGVGNQVPRPYIHRHTYTHSRMY